ncbi:histidinol-phosphate aminotransferase [Striga asiatica]|uniref:Histidinol-phosphate aminotransferase n=1 Tax=Striga asiatica TaxID=4170 RepID=A0A5A7QMY7_STRAF|nr:histidinol-phosphate aminotransferase [Striga asiatica]
MINYHKKKKSQYAKRAKDKTCKGRASISARRATTGVNPEVIELTANEDTGVEFLESKLWVLVDFPPYRDKPIFFFVGRAENLLCRFFIENCHLGWSFCCAGDDQYKQNE